MLESVYTKKSKGGRSKKHTQPRSILYSPFFATRHCTVFASVRDNSVLVITVAVNNILHSVSSIINSFKPFTDFHFTVYICDQID